MNDKGDGLIYSHLDCNRCEFFQISLINIHDFVQFSFEYVIKKTTTQNELQFSILFVVDHKCKAVFFI